MKRILCIHFPLWPIQRRVVAQPELRGRLVLHARDGKRGERVTMCSPAASQLGIRAGMPLAEAQAVAVRGRMDSTEGVNDARRASRSATREFCWERHEPELDRIALQELAAWCERFSPVVGLEDAGEPQCLLLDATGLAPLFGGEEKFLSKVDSSLHARGYYVRLGLADTLGAAWAVAHCGSIWDLEFGIWNLKHEENPKPESQNPKQIPNHKSQITNQSQIRNSKFEIPNFPVAALRLPEETLELLAELGIERIGQLQALPREALAARFGDLLVKRLNQIEGKLPEVIVSYRPCAELKAGWSLEHPTARREAIDQVFEYLIDRLCGLLRERDHGAVRLECQLAMTQRPPARFAIGLFRPTARAEHLLELIRLQLDGLTSSLIVPRSERFVRGANNDNDGLHLPAEVSGIHAAATVTAPLEVEQGQLFPDRQRDAPRRLAVLVDRLSVRLGRDHVLGPRLQAEALPERAFQYISLTGRGAGSPRRSAKQRKGQSRQKKSGAAGLVRFSQPGGRPLKMYDPPLSLQVISVAPDGPPMRFHISVGAEHTGQEKRTSSPLQTAARSGELVRSVVCSGELVRFSAQTVAHHWGPERIETSWWRGRTVRRDYWRVETAAGTRYWLFRQLADGQWFLHGEFI